MRHAVAGYKLCRDSDHRRAMLRNLAVAVFTHGQITTTLPKAKSVQPLVEKVITLAKKGDLASRRRVISKLNNPIVVRTAEDEAVTRNAYGEVVKGPKLVKKIFDEIAPKFADRAGGYTRIVRLGKHRIGDGSDLVVLMLVGGEEGPEVKGRYSRRRQAQDKRATFASKLRKARAEKAEAPAAEAPKAE